MMMLSLRESGHSIFRATSALDRWFWQGGKLSVHCNGDLSNAELLFRTIISVNQLNVCSNCGLVWRIGSPNFSLMVHIEKMMGRLIGIQCYVWYAAISKTRMPGDGRIRNEWIFFNKEVIKTNLVLPEFRRSHQLHECHPRSLWRNQGWSCIVGQCRSSVQMKRVLLPRRLFPLDALHPSIRADRRRNRCKRGKTNSILRRPGSHEPWARLVETTKGPLQEQVGNPTLYQLTALTKWRAPNLKKLCARKFQLHLRHKKMWKKPGRSNAMSNFSVVPGNRSRMERSSKSTSEFKEYHKKRSIKMKIERGESESWRILSKTNQKKRHWSQICKRRIRSTHLAKSQRKIIHNLGNVEYCELCEVSSKTQCSSCAKFWPDGVVYCACGHCLIPQKRQGWWRKKRLTCCRYSTSS